MTAYEDLDTLLARKVEELVRDVGRGVSPGPESYFEIERLAKLRATSRELKPADRSLRWPVVVLASLVFVAVGALLFFRISPVEVEFDLVLSSVSFVLVEQRQLTRAIDVNELSLYRFDALELPATSSRPRPMLLRSPVFLWVAPDRAGGLSLAPLEMPKNVSVRVTKGEAPGSFRLLFGETQPPRSGLKELKAGLSGSVEMAFHGGQERLEIGRPKAAYLRAAEQPLSLEIESKQDAVDFLPHIRAAGLDFSMTIDEVLDRQILSREASAILSGTVYNESLHGRQHVLRPGEWLQLEGSRGEIRILRLASEGVQLSFQGWVDEITTGRGPNRRSLRPSYLEWLTELYGLKLLWGSALSLFTLAMGIYKWWQKSGP